MKRFSHSRFLLITVLVVVSIAFLGFTQFVRSLDAGIHRYNGPIGSAHFSTPIGTARHWFQYATNNQWAEFQSLNVAPRMTFGRAPKFTNIHCLLDFQNDGKAKVTCWFKRIQNNSTWDGIDAWSLNLVQNGHGYWLVASGGQG